MEADRSAPRDPRFASLVPDASSVIFKPNTPYFLQTLATLAQTELSVLHSESQGKLCGLKFSKAAWTTMVILIPCCITTWIEHTALLLNELGRQETLRGFSLPLTENLNAKQDLILKFLQRIPEINPAVALLMASQFSCLREILCRLEWSFLVTHTLFPVCFTFSLRPLFFRFYCLFYIFPITWKLFLCILLFSSVPFKAWRRQKWSVHHCILFVLLILFFFSFSSFALTLLFARSFLYLKVFCFPYVFSCLLFFLFLFYFFLVLLKHSSCDVESRSAKPGTSSPPSASTIRQLNNRNAVL